MVCFLYPLFRGCSLLICFKLYFWFLANSCIIHKIFKNYNNLEIVLCFLEFYYILFGTFSYNNIIKKNKDKVIIKGGIQLMKKKKIVALVLAASMAGGMLAGCGATSSGDETAKGDKSSEKKFIIWTLNQEQADQWVELAKSIQMRRVFRLMYRQQHQELTSHSWKIRDGKDEEHQHLFQVNGPVGLATWKNYCYDPSVDRRRCL